MSEWKEYKLGEIVKLIGGGTPNTTNSNYWGGDIPWLSVSDFNKGRKYVYDAEKHITQEGLNNSSTKILHKEDIIISARGTVGVVAMIGREMAFNQSCYGVRGKELIDQQYLYYLLIHSVQGLKQNAYGGVFDTITRETFDLIDISLPPIDEQKRIAGVLSSLDDKIDLLNRENATLEALAETLFRHYFIENPDPTWKEGKLGELIEVKYGKDHKKLGDGSIPVIGSGGIMRYADNALFDGESVLIPRKGSLDNVMYIDEPFWTVDTMFYTKMKIPHVAKFVYQFMKTLDLVNMNVGSAVPSMTAEVLNNIPLEIPSQTALDDYERVVAPFYKKTKSNQQQMQTLAIQQDTLLPRLMSGEVEVTWQ